MWIIMSSGSKCVVKIEVYFDSIVEWVGSRSNF